MNKHQCQLETLCQKFLIRYGVNDQLVLELHAELAKCKQGDGAMDQSVLRNFQPHEVHTLSSAKHSH